MKYDDIPPSIGRGIPRWVDGVGEIIKREDGGIQPCAVCHEPTSWVEPAAFDCPLCSSECSKTFWGDCGAGSGVVSADDECDDIPF